MPRSKNVVFLILLLMMPASVLRASQPSQRIVSLNLCTDELLVRLTDESRIAALMQYSGRPESSTVWERVANIPKIKGEIEEVLSFDPDLVLAGRFSNASTVRFLKRLEIPVVVFEVAQDFEAIYKNIRLMAETLGEQSKGEVLISEMQSRLAEVGKKDFQTKPRILFYQSGGNVPGAQTFQDAIIKQTGAQHLAAEMGIVGHAHVGLEHLLFENPDALIFLDGQHKRDSLRSEILFHPAIPKGLPDTKTFTLPSRLLNCGSPASTEAVDLLANQLKEYFK